MRDAPTETFLPPAGNTRRDDVELFAFTLYALSRWRTLTAACITSIAIVVMVSLLLPKKYTATATILIEPPAGNDPRGSTAVSPVYLESLKTYEHFASSDSLFEQALQQLDLRRKYAGVPIEVIKRRVLQVSKPRDTKVLEIGVTLPRQTEARDLARYIAEQTVEMNHALSKASIQELAEGGQAVFQQALKRANQAKQARDSFLAEQPVFSLDAEVAQATDLNARLRRERSETRIDLAAYEARAESEKKLPSASGDLPSILQAIAADRAQIGSLEKQIEETDKTMTGKANLLERRKHTQEFLEKDLQAAQAQYEAASNRNSELMASVAFRGERLEIIDPGVLPERPSFPNLPLNIALAGIASFFGIVLYLTLSYSYSLRRVALSYSSLDRE
jgi:uncharacterized protein involved in exopolysaccharide biosynthesis